MSSSSSSSSSSTAALTEIEELKRHGFVFPYQCERCTYEETSFPSSCSLCGHNNAVYKTSLASLKKERDLFAADSKSSGICSQEVPLALSERILEVCFALRKAKEQGAGLVIMTGAGMSVQSGVPVFRNSDGTMSADFERFLHSYNQARRRSNLSEAEDWFTFSVPEMFNKETAKEAWEYWRWRLLRAQVHPGDDYRELNRIISYFGHERIFVETSNCDELHLLAGCPPNKIREIHGSIRRLQCSKKCSNYLSEVNSELIERLRCDEGYFPKCHLCNEAMRPNVMIFDDNYLFDGKGSVMEEQHRNWSAFEGRFKNNVIVLEVGAGVVVPSIRYFSEKRALSGWGLVRINPSLLECQTFEVSKLGGGQVLPADKYFPLTLRSEKALSLIADMLELPK